MDSNSIRQIFRLSDVVTIGVSKYGGYGLFSMKNLSQGAILTNINQCIKDIESIEVLSDQHKERSLLSFINDNNMIYPKTWNLENIYTSLNSYILTSDNNNIVLDHDCIIITKDINVNEELTRRYGVFKWLNWLLMDIIHLNPFTELFGTPYDSNMRLNLAYLFGTANYFGFSSFAERFINRLSSGDHTSQESVVTEILDELKLFIKSML